MNYPPMTKSSREIAFTAADEAAFSRLLKERFGGIAVVPDSALPTADIPVWSVIPECGDTIADVLLPDAAGRPPKPKRALSGGYVMAPSHFSFRIVRCRWIWRGLRPAKWAWDPPTLGAGRVSTSVGRDDQDAKAFVRALWYLLDKFSCRQFQIEYPHLGTSMDALYPDQPPTRYDPKKRGGSDTRAGADALRWCLEKPGRMIDGCFRPADGWTFPEWLKPYYREEEMAETDRMTETPPEGMR